jgi:DNA-binding CsgD family transcriptional regulator
VANEFFASSPALFRLIEGKSLVSTTPSPAHKTVCVISALQLQNQFLARRLEAQGDMNCFTAESVDEARSSLGKEYDRITLFLFDCWEKDLAREVEGFKAAKGLLPKKSIVGLFNVDRKLWENEITLPSQVKGVFFVGVSVEDFLRGVSSMLEGKSWLTFDQGVCVGEDVSSNEPLTQTEKFILSMIQQDKSNQEIADALGVTYSTVKNHCENLFRKLKVSNRFQAALRTKNRDATSR